MRLHSVDPVPLIIVQSAKFPHTEYAYGSTNDHIFDMLLGKDFALSLVVAFPSLSLTGL